MTGACVEITGKKYEYIFNNLWVVIYGLFLINSSQLFATGGLDM